MCGMKLLIHSETSTVEPLKLGMNKKFQSTRSTECDYLSMLELKLDHISKRGCRCHLMWWKIVLICAYIFTICYRLMLSLTKNAIKYIPIYLHMAHALLRFVVVSWWLGLPLSEFVIFPCKIMFPSKVAYTGISLFLSSKTKNKCAKTGKTMAKLWDHFTNIYDYIIEIGNKCFSFDSSDVVRSDRLSCYINSMCKLVTVLLKKEWRVFCTKFRIMSSWAFINMTWYPYFCPFT